MILGNWKSKSTDNVKERWHLGLFGSVYIGSELAISGF